LAESVNHLADMRIITDKWATWRIWGQCKTNFSARSQRFVWLSCWRVTVDSRFHRNCCPLHVVVL